MKLTYKKSIVGLAILTTLSGCNVLDQTPQASLDSATAINDATTAQAALYGAYNALQTANAYGTRLTLLPDLEGGNLTHTGTFPSFAQIANRSILTDNAEVTNAWNILYDGVNRVNNVIAKVPTITDPTFSADNKNFVVAEATFLRAFYYFTLVRLWGGVPIITQPTTVVSSALQVAKSPAADVYAQINADLDKAIASLPATYAGAAGKGRATKPAALAMKAKVALYQQKWADAASFAQQASTGYSLVPKFTDLFEAKNTAESIWELQQDPTNQNSLAFFLLSTARGGRNEVRPSTSLATSYSATDARAILTTSFDSKIKYYRISTQDDNIIMIRLGEVLLTRAEALNELGGDANLATAVTLVNQIRTRAGLTPVSATTAASQSLMRDEIFLQRRLELALEGGNYFYDLVRTGRAATRLANWNPNQALWPIPNREINANPALKQNDGY
ncbi:RagB/SusD family nutrient uptake outer membrane protein [Fibrella sp. HMF5335]|uniref:RagB/SusD family nutrient uptake outer membrane protein n=1 Tax=Fibrella rubiginis TaxID=2817060 RepID=A0A939GFZ6_9BACT|nr:RagB/SusD family nutrient uptake outer membrane protein [Fibrella rubiginis]MBO0936090.1 RagB/SusD family nutrient uptake outer membrane protein [Fibrella rubiginis]